MGYAYGAVAPPKSQGSSKDIYGLTDFLYKREGQIIEIAQADLADFNHNRVALTKAAADCGHAASSAAAAQAVDERLNNACAAGAQRKADRNGAAIDVGAFAQPLSGSTLATGKHKCANQGRRSIGFVDLDRVPVAGISSVTLGDAHDRSCGRDRLRCRAAVNLHIIDESRERFEHAFQRKVPPRDDNKFGPVAEAARIARGNGLSVINQTQSRKFSRLVKARGDSSVVTVRG